MVEGWHDIVAQREAWFPFADEGSVAWQKKSDTSDSG